MRAQTHVTGLAEYGSRELKKRPLEVGERDVLVHGESLDLVKLRRMGGVGVRPVHAPWDDDVEGRRMLLHRSHLHRRGVCAHQQLLRAGGALGAGRCAL